MALGIGVSFAEEIPAPYQSTFEDYKATNSDNQKNWKSLDSSIADQGHQMSGMQHASDQPMNHEAMGHSMSHGDTHASHGSKSQMPPMDHNSMPGMDHSKMHEMNSQAEDMDHSMASMDHKSSSSEMSAHTHDHGMHAEMGHHSMQNMNHSGSESEEALSMAHAHGNSESELAEEDFSSHIHESSEALKSEVPSEHTGFQIVPNLHPAIVHFPIALTMVAFILGLAARLRRQSASSTSLDAAAYHVLILAAVSAVAAVGFGWLAFNSTMNHDDAGHAAMLLHRAWAIPTAVGLVLVAVWHSLKSRQDMPMSIPVLVCLAGLSMAVTTTAWLGGEVVYRHGIGVLSLPASGGHHHVGHHHGEASESAIPAQDNHSGHQHESSSEGDSHAH
ncbi:hypothetical protein ASG24_13440 [Methylophilus sp. Leaf414]|nr:hypothetical protein ASG24_13440 [Methylophilus sp. Leaf414]KQT42525.1 hypothetical protein ASG34_07225 [Methylophilus sp. Leaf416]KQT56708.1 hypothetical protein ASG44_07200 [Methylophilus sp. Leaf459]